MKKLPNAQESKKQMQNLGFYLPVIRDGFKWSLEELGNRLGVSKQTIANIEK
jgi:DNA-binding XRE family transcriptional regulator